ncbi:nitrate/nitrite transporter [Pseudarthrobacter sp. AG30]|uniref:MFS transporter n=1 Tax=Pseudarthrobacter sp. AG30 TaxID=2249742 RepID=UPI001402C964|nr:MFS transporter [Pseudarthrobacter sp. AG30]
MTTVQASEPATDTRYKTQRLMSTVGAGILMMLMSVGIGFGFTVQVGMERFGVGATQYSIWMSAFQLSCALSYSAIGALARRFPVRNIVIVAGLLATASMTGMAFAPTFLWLSIGAVFFGIGFAGCGIVTANALISQWHTHGRTGTVFGFVASGVGVGGFVWGLIFPPVVSSGGFTGTMLLIALIVFICSVVNALVLVRSAPATPLILTPEPAGHRNQRKAALAGLGVVVALLVASSFIFALEGGWPLVMAAVLQSNGISLTTAGLMISLWALVAIVAKPILGHISDRVGMLPLFILLAIIFIVSLPGMALFGHLGEWVYFVLIPVVSLAMGVNGVVLPLVVLRSVGRSAFPQVYGFTLTAVSLAVAISLPLWGLSRDLTGSYNAAMICAGFAGVAGLALLYVARSVGRKKSAPTDEDDLSGAYVGASKSE